MAEVFVVISQQKWLKPASYKLSSECGAAEIAIDLLTERCDDSISMNRLLSLSSCVFVIRFHKQWCLNWSSHGFTDLLNLRHGIYGHVLDNPLINSSSEAGFAANALSERHLLRCLRMMRRMPTCSLDSLRAPPVLNFLKSCSILTKH